MKNYTLVTLALSAILLITESAHASEQGSLEILTNSFVAHSLVCHGAKLTQIDSLKALPSKVQNLIPEVSDNGGQFNAGDVGGGPHRRFIIGAVSKDIALVAIEQGGLGYNVQLWTFIGDGNTWQPAPSYYFNFGTQESRKMFLPLALKSFDCKQTDGSGATDTDVQLAAVLQKEADHGDIAAQYTLGHFFATGRGVPKDLSQAAKWFKKAGEKDPIAQYDLGQLYLNGTDLPRDPAAAMQYFRLASGAKQEALKRAALIQIAYIYADGKGVAANPVAGYALLELEPDYGDQQLETKKEQLKKGLSSDQLKLAEELQTDMFLAKGRDGSDMEELDYFLAHGRGKKSLSEVRTYTPPPPNPKPPSAKTAEEYYGELDYAHARQIYLQRAQKGDDFSENILGAMSLWGRATDKNPKVAISWFLKAAEHGNRMAKSNLGAAYQMGIGVTADLQQAQAWYGKGAKQQEKRALAMLPIISAAIGERKRENKPLVGLPLSDLELFGSEPDRCDIRARKVLQHAESELPKAIASVNDGGNAAGKLRGTEGHLSMYDVYVETVSEYAWAGCFHDAARLLDSHTGYGKHLRDFALYGVSAALTHFGADERALAVSYTVESDWAQEEVLRLLLIQTAQAGKIDLALDYIDTVGTQDQLSIRLAYFYIMRDLAKIGDHNGVIRFGTNKKSKGELGVDGNLLLAQAYLGKGDRRNAMKALREAQSHVKEFEKFFFTPYDNLQTRIARIQARLEPEAIDTVFKSNPEKDVEYRISLLSAAIYGASDPRWRRHWLEEIDKLALPITAKQKDYKFDSTLTICTAADGYALLGQYSKALMLRQERLCNPQDDLLARLDNDTASVLTIAASQNDILRALSIISTKLQDPQAGAQEYLGPLIFGRVRAGNQAQALQDLKKIAASPVRRKDNIIDLIAAVGQVADNSFPVRNWIDEVRADHAKLKIGKWDALRILFATSARNLGFDAAVEMTGNLSKEDRISADIGIAEGLRNFQPEGLNPDMYPR